MAQRRCVYPEQEERAWGVSKHLAFLKPEEAALRVYITRLKLQVDIWFT